MEDIIVRNGLDTDGVPTTFVKAEDFRKGIPLWKIFTLSELCKSHSEVIRMARQGGLYWNDIRISEAELDAIIVRGDNNEKKE